MGCAFPILCFQSLCLLYHHHTVHFTRYWMPMIGCWQKVTFTRRLIGDSGKRTSRLPFPKGISTCAVWMNWSLCGLRKLTDSVFLWADRYLRVTGKRKIERDLPKSQSIFVRVAWLCLIGFCFLADTHGLTPVVLCQFLIAYMSTVSFRRRPLLSENTRCLTAKAGPSDGEMGRAGEPDMERWSCRAVGIKN